MVRTILLGLIFIFSLTFCSLGQTPDSLATGTPEKKYYLILGKLNKPRRFRFYEGNTITLKLTNGKDYYTGEIATIREDAIVFWETEIKLRDIEKIRVINKTRIQKATQKVSAIFRKGGFLFMLVGAGNFVLAPGSQSDGVKTMAAALALYGTGQALRPLQKRNYKTAGRWQLKTLETIY